MSKKTAKYVQYDGALYRIKEGGGLGTTRPETNVTLFEKDFSSEGALQYSGTPDGGQFFFESRVKFPDGTMLPVTLEIDEESAAEIIRKLRGGESKKEFPHKWRAQLPARFLELIGAEDKGALPGRDEPEALPAPREGAVTKPKRVAATLHPWRPIPALSVSSIEIRFGAVTEDQEAVEKLSRHVHLSLTTAYPKARIAVRVDPRDATDAAYLRVCDASGTDTQEHDEKIQGLIADLWRRMGF